MSYIELNGVSSITIPGLLIQTLPPISLPAIRTQIETIDGRDGDIITKLGYSAYDKTVSIGLHGSFDINEVIEFFASDGEVIFSNEPDKIYEYKILNQIDFNRLLRFRTANVTFHVQPFKHDDVVYTKTSGNEAVVTNAGNIYSKPTIKLTGTGTVYFYINTSEIFRINLGNSSRTIIISAEEMNAVWEDDNSFANRSVVGDYSGLILPVGENIISYTNGTISEFQISRFSRWL